MDQNFDSWIEGGSKMEPFNGKKKIDIRLYICLVFGLVFISTVIMINDFNRQIFAQTEKEKAEKKDDSKLNVLNLYGRALGSVDTDGNILNRYGKFLGSVDTEEGTVFNVSKIVIGKIDPKGKVFNQSGTALGSVDTDGNVFNVSGRKVGTVKAGGNLILIGGAARLLLLKVK